MARASVLGGIALAALAMPAAAWGAVLAGAHTHGGAVPGAAVLHVTNLGDSGPGSLRAAIQTRGPRVIVFDVAGVIHLASDLKVSLPQVTIAGQTAPHPGVTLTGGTLLLRASDIVVQHIAVRPGPGPTPEINGNRDSITIGGGTHPLHDVRVENVSLSWSVDENADAGGGTENITLRDNIIAEALNNAGHPKGHHSMGMLINKDNQGVAVTGNLFVSNMFRNPVVARGSSAFIGYNLIVNPGQNAVHFYDVEAPTPIRASVIGNVVVAGADTKHTVTAVLIPDDMAEKAPDAQIYLSGNRAAAGPLTNRGDFKLVASPPVQLADAIAPPDDVRAWVLRHAGARPADRDAVDRRIVAGAEAGTARIIDNPAQVGGLADTPPVFAAAAVPSNPFGASLDGLTRVEVWLCERHLTLGGPQTPECPRDLAAYRNALSSRISERR